MDAQEKLLVTCRELHARMSDCLAAEDHWHLWPMIESLVADLKEQATACGYLSAPIEWYPDAGGCEQWQAWSLDGLRRKFDGPDLPDREWWEQARTMLATWTRGLEPGHRPDAQADNGNNAATADDEALLSAARLAEMSGNKPEGLRKRLERFRKGNHDGWVENTERGPSDPQFVYRYGAVKHLLKGK